MPQLPRRPLIAIDPVDAPELLPEGTADVGGIERLPTADEKTRPCSSHSSSAASRSHPRSSNCCQRASTQRVGRASVSRDFRVLVSPLLRTDRQTAMCGGCGGSRSGRPFRKTWSQVRARSSSVRAPVRSATTMYAYIEVPSAPLSKASAWAKVSVPAGSASEQAHREPGGPIPGRPGQRRRGRGTADGCGTSHRMCRPLRPDRAVQGRWSRQHQRLGLVIRSDGPGTPPTVSLGADAERVCCPFS